MPGKKIDQKIKNNAKIDFASGMTLEHISKKYGIKIRTVKDWHNKGKWKDARKSVKQKAEECILNRVSEKIFKNTEQHIDVSQFACRLAFEIAINAYKRKDSKNSLLSPAEKELLKIAEQLARISSMTASMQNTIMPSANEELLDKAIDELERLKRMNLE